MCSHFYIVMFCCLVFWIRDHHDLCPNSPSWIYMSGWSFIFSITIQSWEKWTSVWLELKHHPSCLLPFTSMNEIGCKTFPFYQLHYFILSWFVIRVSLCWRLILILLDSGVLLLIKKSPWILILEYLHDYISRSVDNLVSYHQQEASLVLISNFIFFITTICCGHLTVAR